MIVLRTSRLLAIGLFVSLFGARASADAFSLEVPVNCTLGTECFVQNYFDHAPGEDAVDYNCGPLVYDGHDGTDFRTRTLSEMRAGVEVLAAASGVVVGIRNTMEDVLVGDIGRDALEGRGAGNGVRIDHGNGWVTQYAHMMKGSITVEVGQQVKAGDVLGLIGLSGNTAFPHLHLSVSHNDIDVDPFTGSTETYQCGEPTEPLWSTAAQAALGYVSGGPLQAGFADAPAEYRAAREGAYDAFTLETDSDALVFWAEFFGVLEGDRIRLELKFPDDFDTITDTVTMDRNRAQQFNFVGRRLPTTGWPAGTYEGTARLLRTIDGVEQTLGMLRKTITFEP